VAFDGAAFSIRLKRSIKHLLLLVLKYSSLTEIEIFGFLGIDVHVGINPIQTEACKIQLSFPELIVPA